MISKEPQDFGRRSFLLATATGAATLAGMVAPGAAEASPTRPGPGTVRWTSARSTP